MKRIYLVDNNYTDCTESSYLFNKVRAFFEVNNYNIIKEEKDATDILINTCGVWEDIEKKYLNYIDSLLKKYNNKKIYIYGCLSGISSNLIQNYNNKIIIIPTKKDFLIDNYFRHNISIRNINSSLVNKLKIKNPSNIFGDNNKRFYINISRGCIHKCSYCIIKRAIGYVSSRNINDILEDCKYAISSGYNELVLVSDDAGSYGIDIDLSFDILFNKICELNGDYKIDINYVEPGIFYKIFPKIKNNFYKVSKITCPIQSYNDKLLKLMNRQYNVDLFISMINDFRNYGNRDLKIINHIIYAYPTETFEEFKNNLRYINLCDSNLFNLYSYRIGTKKFKNSDLLSKGEIQKRLEILLKFNKKDNILVDLANIYE